jgi:hypothetical protein
VSKKKAPARGTPRASKTRAVAPASPASPPAAPASPPAPVNVLTNRYNNARTGANLAEALLDTGNVAVRTFGKLFSRTVDGDLYAQPLIVCGLNIGGKQRNVVYLATARNWVYAYDADDPEECLPLWSRNLAPPVPRDDIFRNYLNISSYIGIISTPVIEPDGRGGGTMYVAYKERRVSQVDGKEQKEFFYNLRALDILTGQDRPPMHPGDVNPSRIEATAARSDGTTIQFDTRQHLNRPGLLLSKGVIYLAFSSHADYGDYYGWIMAYDSHSLKQLASYNTAPDWGQGGIWQSGTGLAADEEGAIYAVVGNGENPDSNAKKKPPILPPSKLLEPVYGNCILKLELTGDDGKPRGLKVADWFMASNTLDLNKTDDDLIGGPVLFDAAPVEGSSGRLVLGGGKDGKFYLCDREGLGGWMAVENKKVIQADKACSFHIHGAPVIWANSKGETFAFVWSEKDFLRALRMKGKKFDTTDVKTSTYGFPQDELRMPGGILAVSSDGARDGSAVVWASHPTDDDGMNQTVLGTLRAYDARDVNIELWNSDMDAEGNDRVGSLAKFCPPVVANGKVYLSTFSRELVVYGLFSEIGRQPRNDDCGIFTLQDISYGAAVVQKSGDFTCNRYILRISGAGIALDKKEDSFLFAYTNRDALENTEISITARVDGINSQYVNPYAGVMIRKAVDDTKIADPAKLANPLNATRFAAVLVSKEKKALFLHRDVDADPNKQDGPADVTFPCYVRLTAAKDPNDGSFIEFVGDFSSDEGKTWKGFGTKARIAIDGRLMVGLATAAQLGMIKDETTDQAHASFSKVALVPATAPTTSRPPMETDPIPPAQGH